MATHRSNREGSRHKMRSAVLAVLLALYHEILSDHVLMVAGALSYSAAFGVLPALAAAAAIWGLFGDLHALKAAADSGGGLLPQGTAHLLEQFVTGIPQGFGRGTILLLNLGIVVVTSYRAASGLLTALNIVYDVVERRSRLRRAIMALAVGVCGIILLFAVLVVIVWPLLLSPHLRPSIGDGLLWLRWPVLALLLTAGLGLVFRYGPSRQPPGWQSVACGAAAAAIMWAAASAGVSFYVAHTGSFGHLYGSLSSAVIILLWFYADALAVLAGAEIDAVLAARTEGRAGSRLRSELRRRERMTVDENTDTSRCHEHVRKADCRDERLM